MAHRTRQIGYLIENSIPSGRNAFDHFNQMVSYFFFFRTFPTSYFSIGSSGMKGRFRSPISALLGGNERSAIYPPPCLQTTETRGRHGHLTSFLWKAEGHCSNIQNNWPRAHNLAISEEPKNYRRAISNTRSYPRAMLQFFPRSGALSCGTRDKPYPTMSPNQS